MRSIIQTRKTFRLDHFQAGKSTRPETRNAPEKVNSAERHALEINDPKVAPLLAQPGRVGLDGAIRELSDTDMLGRRRSDSTNAKFRAKLEQGSTEIRIREPWLQPQRPQKSSIADVIALSTKPIQQLPCRNAKVDGMVTGVKRRPTALRCLEPIQLSLHLPVLVSGAVHIEALPITAWMRAKGLLDLDDGHGRYCASNQWRSA